MWFQLDILSRIIISISCKNECHCLIQCVSLCIRYRYNSIATGSNGNENSNMSSMVFIAVKDQI